MAVFIVHKNNFDEQKKTCQVEEPTGDLHHLTAKQIDISVRGGIYYEAVRESEFHRADLVRTEQSGDLSSPSLE